MEKTNLQWALFYHSLGFCILPAFTGTKAPCIKWEGITKETFTEENIKEWFKHEKNIWLHTGHSGILAIDIDIDPETGDFTEEGRWLLHNLPETVLVRTGRGGYHFIFKNKSDLKKDKIGILPHVDIRCEHGLILPPSK